MKKTETILKLRASRDTYEASLAAENSLTVGELIELLRNYDSDSKVVFSNDGGYTYGSVTEDSVGYPDNAGDYDL